ncbi:MAG: HAD-IC family P-type ATPase [Sandaracinus sp.]|nr:HAD-IC family P-type ATPase [Sandaracinus sp.]
MDALDRLRRAWRTIRHRDRRRWRSGSRAHWETRPVPHELTESFAASAEASLATVPDVRWGRYNAVLGCLVIELGETADDETDGRIAATLADLEDRFGLGDVPFADDEAANHPGDGELRVRTELELGLDVLALGTGLALRFAGAKTLPMELDLAAVVAAVEGIPEARRLLEIRLGKGTTELALNFAKAVSSALIQGAVTPSVDAARRLLRLREVEAREHAFVVREVALCGDPDKHPTTRPNVGPRPRPLPDGPIERYAEKATFASLGGASFGLASSQRLEGAAAGLFGATPRPAYLGREAFAAWLGRLLGRREVVVRSRDALRRLDRVDTLVVEGGLFVDPPEPDVDALVSAAKRAGLRVHRSGRKVPAGAAGVHLLQAEGHGVIYVGMDPGALTAADVGVGLVGDEIPFAADVICSDEGLRDARVIVEAARAARDASKQAVQMAGVELATSVLLSIGGANERTVRRIVLAAHATQVLAMANGIRLAEEVTRPPMRGYHRPSAPFHALSSAKVLSQLETSERGLDEAGVSARRPPAEQPQSRARQLSRLVVEELANPLTPILVGGAGLSALMGGLGDAVMVGSVLSLNTALGVSQRFRTEKGLQDLFADEQRHVRVRRGGQSTRVAAHELVVGDVVELDVGEVVPADGRLLEARGLELDEASLTGESHPVRKQIAEVEVERPVAERASMVYADTVVAAGAAVFVVTATGEETEAQRGLLDADETPAGGVEARLESLTAITAPVAAAAGAAVILAGLARKDATPREIIRSGVSLAVAAVPEGLPLLATSAQLASAKRLSRRGAIVRNPRAIEALGRVDVLCADKTGTLTEGKLKLQLVHDGAHAAAPDALDESLRSVLRVALRATPRRGEEALPHPTDEALAEAGRVAGVAVHEALRVRDVLPFEPARGYHALREENGRVHLKGAPEVLVERCDRWLVDGEERPLDDAGRARLHEAATSMADRGLRVLAIVDGRLSEGPLEDAHLRECRFRGFVGIADPVRATAKRALDDLRRAGVTAYMITGDHPRTARAIAKELAMDGDAPEVVTGAQMDDANDTELGALLERARVFARVTPSQKVRIVRVLKARGRVVAMTGDGANDAQAIRLADVGIALGRGSTGAARHASDLVVADGSVESIVAAVLEGRALWRSVREAVSLLVGGNLGEIGFTLAGGVLGGRSPLNPRQLLLVNLLTDALPAMAVALRPPTSSPDELLGEGPEASLGEALEERILERGVVTAASATAAWMLARMTGDRRGADTVGLLALVGAQLGQTLASGGPSPLVVATGVGSMAALVALIQTPATSVIFGSRPLGPIGLAQAAGAAGAATLASWAWPKLRERRRAAHPEQAPTESPFERAKKAWTKLREDVAAAREAGESVSRE